MYIRPWHADGSVTMYSGDRKERREARKENRDKVLLDRVLRDYHHPRRCSQRPHMETIARWRQLRIDGGMRGYRKLQCCRGRTPCVYCIYVHTKVPYLSPLLSFLTLAQKSLVLSPLPGSRHTTYSQGAPADGRR